MYRYSFLSSESQGKHTQDTGQTCVIREVNIEAGTEREGSTFRLYTARCSESKNYHRTLLKTGKEGQLSQVVFSSALGASFSQPTHARKHAGVTGLWRMENVNKKLNSLFINWLPEECKLFKDS